MEILTGDEVSLPDMESVIHGLSDLLIADKLSIRIKQEKTSLIPFIHYADEKSSMVLIDEKYEALTDIIYDKYITSQACVLKTDDGDIVSVVMGCIDHNSNKTKGDIDIINNILAYS